MLNMDKKLMEESKIELRMNQLEGRVGKVEEKAETPSKSSYTNQ